MLPFCEPGDDYSIPWINGGLSRCFLGVVGSISSAGLLIVLGLAIVVLGPKSKDMKSYMLKKIFSKILISEIILSAIYSLTFVADLAVKGVLHVTGEQIYGYTIVEDVLGILSWLFAILMVYRDRMVVLHRKPHGISLVLFWLLNELWLGLQIVSFNNPQWWWHLKTQADISDLILYAIRVLVLSIIIIVGIFRPLIFRPKSSSGYSLLLNAEETEEEDINTEERNKETRDRKEGSFIRKRTTSAFSGFLLKAKLLFPYVWPKGTVCICNSLHVCNVPLLLIRNLPQMYFM